MTNNQRRLRIAIVGCGQIADAHLQEIAKLKSARVVAVCDRHLDLARQAAARFEIEEVFDDLDALLSKMKPDVVHITTPPHTHASVARVSLAQGAHIYLEKPFSVDLAEAEEICNIAQQQGRLICVGHDQLFDPIWLALKDYIRSGCLGDVIHVDSIMGYNVDGPFGRVMLNDSKHWIHRLPGGLLHNNISHAIYKVTDLISNDPESIMGTWRRSSLGVPIELSAMMQWQKQSAFINFSTQCRPVQRLVRVHGTRSSVEVDFESRTMRKFHVGRFPGPFAKIDVPWLQAWEAATSFFRQAYKFCRSDLQYFAGMNRLFGEFYQAILDGTPAPISPQEVCRVTSIMDDLFAACGKPETNCTLGSSTPQ